MLSDQLDDLFAPPLEETFGLHPAAQELDGLLIRYADVTGPIDGQDGFRLRVLCAMLGLDKVKLKKRFELMRTGKLRPFGA